MSLALTRRAFLTASVAFCGGAALANAPATSLRPQLRGEINTAPSPDQLLREAGLSGVVGYAVMDVETGEMLEERASSAALPPASVAKAITALYALETLGPAHRFTTRVLATGPVEGGVVQGDVILSGGGDPTLDTDDLADLVAQLKAAGVTGVTGAFKLWGGALPFAEVIDAGQPDHVGYNPSVSGLNLNFNRVHFEWKRSSGSYAITMEARTANHRPAVSVAHMAVVDRATPVYTYSKADGVDQWSVARAALGTHGARWLPVRVPEHYAGDVFRTLAAAQGITLPEAKVLTSTPVGTALARVESPPLETLVRDMLRFSTNLTAEVLGMAASVKRRGRVSSLRASAREMTAWAKQDLGMGTNTRFVDHSGLGDASRVTAADMTRALRGMPALRSLLKDIPMRDAQRRILSNPPAEVNAKTGTLNFVSALAGFSVTEQGRALSFAILVADTTRRAAIPREERERPRGARPYNAAAKGLQQRLLRRWGRVYA